MGILGRPAKLQTSAKGMTWQEGLRDQESCPVNDCGGVVETLEAWNFEVMILA